MTTRWKYALAWSAAGAGFYVGVFGAAFLAYRLTGDKGIAASAALLMASVIAVGGLGYDAGMKRERDEKRGEG